MVHRIRNAINCARLITFFSFSIHLKKLQRSNNMKLKLTRAMLLAILMAGTYQAEAARSGYEALPGYIDKVDTNETLVVSPDTEGMNQAFYRPYVKDGVGTASISASGTMNAALFVREGTVAVTSSGNTRTVVELNPALAGNNRLYDGLLLDRSEYDIFGTSTSLSISGANAAMTIDGATVRSKVSTSMVVGSLDGNGALSLTNGAILNNQKTAAGIGFFVGAMANGGDNYYPAHIHGTKAEANANGYTDNESGYKAAQNAVEYTGGIYTTLSDGTKIGAGSVTVDGGSRLFGGYMTFALGQGQITVKDGSQIFAVYDNVAGSNEERVGTAGMAPIGGSVDQYETVFGAAKNTTSVVNVESGENGGGKFYIGSGLKVAAYDGTAVTINVDGEGSLLKVEGSTSKTYVGHTFSGKNFLQPTDRSWNLQGGAKNATATFNVTNGGAVELQDAYLGHSSGGTEVAVNIGKESSFSAKSLDVQNGTTITNSGELSATGTITLNGGKLILQDEALVEATQLIIKSGAVLETAEFSDDTAVMLFAMTPDEEALMEDPSTAMVNAELVLESGALVNLNNVALDLNGKALTMGDNVQVTYTGNVAADKELILFRNVGNAAEGTEYELTLNGQATTATVSGDNIVIAASVPEPTTATLSLLALAALAARRRRK